jgi:hypothetical protein
MDGLHSKTNKARKTLTTVVSMQYGLAAGIQMSRFRFVWVIHRIYLNIFGEAFSKGEKKHFKVLF